MAGPPSGIAQLLSEAVAPGVSERLRAELRRPFVGGMIRMYLPQTWWFVSESGSATFHVDREGTASVRPGTSGEPDVTVRWTDAAYRAAIVLRDRSRIPPDAGSPQVVAHTGRGATAFGQVRRQLGL